MFQNFTCTLKIDLIDHPQCFSSWFWYTDRDRIWSARGKILRCASFHVWYGPLNARICLWKCFEVEEMANKLDPPLSNMSPNLKIQRKQSEISKSTNFCEWQSHEHYCTCHRFANWHLWKLSNVTYLHTCKTQIPHNVTHKIWPTNCDPHNVAYTIWPTQMWRRPRWEGDPIMVNKAMKTCMNA